MNYDLTALDTAIQKYICDTDIPGLTVSIRGPEGVIFEKGYGYGAENCGCPLNEHTIMGIASMSKSTVALALCILAAEDVGLANPNALLLANATFQIVHTIGMPEARIPLAECTIYLASSAKSNSAYMAINEALAVAKETQMAAVPLYLRNAPTKLMEELGYADGYKYAHDYPGHFADLEFMPSELSGHCFYTPADNKHEEGLKNRLESLWPKYYKK